MKKSAEHILIDWKAGKVNFDEIRQYLELEVGKECTQKVENALFKLLLPFLAIRYGNVTKSSVGVRYYNQLQGTIALYGDKINRKSAEQAYLDSERMKVEWFLKIAPAELRKTLLIWKEFLAKKKPYSHRVNAMSRYYFPSSMPIGKPPRKGEGEYEEYNKFIKARHGREGISYRPFLKAYITVIDLLIEFPVCQKDAVLDALQMIIYYDNDDNRMAYDMWKEIENDKAEVSVAIDLLKSKL